MQPTRVLFLFLDGVGVGPDDPSLNPFFSAELPVLSRLLDGRIPCLENPESAGEGAMAFPLDALLGVEGLPQSGTGQTALLTGENAPALYGRHFGPWVPVRLRPLLAEKNLLAIAARAGLPSAFANAYPSIYPRTRWARRPAAPPLAARAAGLLTRDEEALARGEAVSSEMVNTAWRERLGMERIPETTPLEAGATLAKIAGAHRLTLYAHYATDLEGHKKSLRAGVRALERVDAFLGGLLPGLPPELLLVVASDHGNLEDAGRGHTTNPSLCILAGPGARALRKEMTRITDVAPVILGLLGLAPGSGG